MLTKTMHLDNSGELKYWTGELDCSENDPTHQAQSVCEWERGRQGEGATVRVVGSPTGSFSHSLSRPPLPDCARFCPLPNFVLKRARTSNPH